MSITHLTSESLWRFDFFHNGMTLMSNSSKIFISDMDNVTDAIIKQNESMDP